MKDKKTAKRSFLQTTKGYYITFTVLFIITFFVGIHFWLFRNGKSYIWNVDGISTQYPVLLYYHRYIVETISNLSKGIFELKMWENSIGFGTDIVSFFGKDPLFFLVSIFPVRYLEKVFALLLVFETYLSGITFSAYMRRRVSNLGTLIGAISYCFTGCILISLKQIGFLWPYILIPLIFLGMERIWNGKSGKLYVVSISFLTIISYYFTYMTIIMLVVYFLVKYSFEERESKNLRDFFGLFIKYILYSIPGMVFALGLILPSLMLILNTDRLSVKRTIPFFYNIHKVRSIIVGWISTVDLGTDDIIGFSIISFIAVFGLLFLKKRYRAEKVMFLLSTFALFSSKIGSLINGSAYATNRWIFGYAFLLAIITALFFDGIREYSFKQFVAPSICLVLYGLYVGKLLNYRRIDYWYPVIIGVLLLLATCIILLISKRYAGILKALFPICCVLFAMLAGVTNTALYLVQKGDNFESNLVPKDAALNQIEYNDGKSVLLDYSDYDQVRYDEIGSYRFRNSDMAYGTNSFDFYSPNYNNDIEKYFDYLAMNKLFYATSYEGIDARSNVAQLNGVKYYITPHMKHSDMVPNGYSFKETKHSANGLDYDVYESSYASMGYWYPNAISTKSTSKLNIDEKERVMLSSVIIDDGEKKVEPVLESNQVPFDIRVGDHTDYKSNKVSNKGNSGSIYLDLKKPVKGSELHVYLKNLDNPSLNVDYYSVSVSAEKKNEDPLKTARINTATELSHLYTGKKDWLVNLGQITDDVDEIKITIEAPGEFSLDDIQVYAQPVEQQISAYETLAENKLDVKLGLNSIQTTVSKESDGFVFLSVPYSDGWSATIDGKNTEIKKADTAFMAIKVPKGKHSVRLHFRSPYLYEGLLISVVDLIGVFVFITVKNKFRQKKQRKVA